jgi:hypothetical protein
MTVCVEAQRGTHASTVLTRLVMYSMRTIAVHCFGVCQTLLALLIVAVLHMAVVHQACPRTS